MSEEAEDTPTSREDGNPEKIADISETPQSSSSKSDSMTHQSEITTEDTAPPKEDSDQGKNADNSETPQSSSPKSDSISGQPENSRGEDSEISDVLLSQNSESAHDSLKLTWINSSNTPVEYKVKIFKHDDDEHVKQITKKHPEHEVTFSNLDHMTEYYCTVRAKYADGRKGTLVKSNSMKTTDLPGELFQAQNVEMMKGNEIPSRQILVKWKKPKYRGEDLGIRDYEVYLTDGNNVKTDDQNIHDKRECTFNRLKSSTTYTAHVISITQENHKIATISSASITTEKARRKEGFKIETGGKVTITKCEAFPKEEPRTAMLEWKLPELGIEEYNYALDAIQVFVATPNSEKKECRVIEECKIDPIAVELGKNYTFTVECKYTDIDKGKTVTPKNEAILKNTVQPPKIEQIDFGKEMVVKWKKGQAAKKHNLTIRCSGQEIWSAATLTPDEHTIVIGETLKNYYGKLCTFKLEATGANGTVKVVEEEKLFGGPFVATDALASTEKRGVTINWKAPDQCPDRYLVELFDQSTKVDPCDRFTTKDSRPTKHTFSDLKSNTAYFCKIYPILKKERGNPTMSNSVTTDKRCKFPIEADADFGKITKISHTFASDDEVLLSWQPPDVGLNFKVVEYDIKLVENHTVSRFLNKTLREKKMYSPNVETSIKGISIGTEYAFTITSWVKDLDTSYRKKSKEAKLLFKKNPSQTTIKDCVCKDGSVTFSWEPVHDATKYELQVMDQEEKEELVQKQTTTVSKDHDGCSIKLKLDDKLRIGCYCVAKVTTYVGKTASQSPSKLQLIGGRKVVKNVTATLNISDPYRSVDIAFDRPLEEAAEHQYKVVATSSDGKKKEKVVDSTRLIFKHLKKGSKYYFVVFAKWGDEWSEGSRSNSVKTNGNANTSLINIKGVSPCTIALKRSNVQDNTDLKVYNTNRGQIRNLQHTSEKKNEEDQVTLKWQAPEFAPNTPDFKVELYRVEIYKNNTRIGCDDTIETQYSTDLKWGGMYQIKIFTLYEYIDISEYMMSSSETLQLPTTPCKPEFTKTESSGSLNLKWNSVQGAESYTLELHVKNKEPIVKELSIKKTSYQRPFDETLGYGNEFYAVLKAFGKDKKTFNETKTEAFLIGGEYTPTNVEATSEGVNDPSSHVIVRWKRPNIKPDKYKVEVFPAELATGNERITHTGTECQVAGLKSGKEYYFKITANHNKHRYIVGSFSNRIKTNPVPAQIQNVKLEHGDNRATSIKVQWDEANKEESTENLHYVITLIQGTSETNEMATSPPHIVRNLVPHTSYQVMVRACNADGDGLNSEKVLLTTEVGTPKDVKLVPNPNKPTSQLNLSFTHAEGNNLLYRVRLFKSQTKNAIKEKNVKDISFTFDNLDGNIEYFATVNAKTNDGADGMSETSNKTKTAPKKPFIEKLKCLGPKIISVEWTCDQGCELHEVTISCNDKMEDKLIVNKKNLSHQCLNEGARYYVQVRSKNSSGYFGKASDQLFIDLAFQSPVIDRVDFEKKIVVKWIEGQGASGHNLSILHSDQKIWFSATLEKNEHFIDIDESLKNYYGKLCTFKIEATADNRSPLTAEERILFGRPSVVSDVDVIAENRSVIIKWKAPDAQPDRYLVELFENSESNPCAEFKSEDSSTTTYTFTDLKSSTSYFCKIYPIFKTEIGNASTSKIVATRKRGIFQMEKHPDFGKTKISHEFILDDEVLLTWHSPNTGPNFKVIEYNINLVEHGYFFFIWKKQTTLLDKKLDPSILKTSSKKISKGSTYTFKITTVLKDLDKEECRTNDTKFTFTKKPSPTTIKDCVCKDGLVTFSWEPVKGATSYELHVMDQDQQNDLVDKKTTTVSKKNDGCSVELQLDDKLRIGRYCMTKVTTYADKEKTESDSRLQLIGSRKVVKNVTATSNKADPYRSVDIAFDRPQDDTAEHQYKVVATFSDEKKKEKIVELTHLTFKHLVKGSEYYFEVFAKWGNEWSEGSRSNTINTAGSADTSLINIGSLKRSNIELSNVQGNTSLNVYNTHSGQVRNLCHTSEKKHKKDAVTLTWQAPNFGANTSDYKVESYRVEIFKNKTKLACDDTSETKYSKDLEWGGEYEISVCTLYEYIDIGEYLMSSATKLKIFTTPCEPEFHKPITNNDELKLEWNSVQGAESYTLELHIENEKPIVKDLSVRETTYRRPFNKTLGYGKMFHAVLKAFGKDKNSYNETTTETFLLGGRYAPANVMATSIGVSDPSSQVIVTWTSSEIEPDSYNIEIWPTTLATGNEKKNYEGSKCEISGLKTGTEYYFKTIANHNNHQYTVGSFSNMVKTNPAPTQVQNVKVYHGDNRATSMEVHWSKVNERENAEEVRYDISLARSNGEHETSVSVFSPPYIFKHLKAHTSYQVTVRACNKHGAGRYSEIASLTTEVETPKNVKLTPDPKMPTSQLVLSFSKAEGNDLQYLVALFKYQNEAEIEVEREKTVPQSPFIFGNLLGNTEYLAKVWAKENDGTKGVLVSSNNMTTAPNQPVVREINHVSSQNIMVEWTSGPGCHSHEVSISCKDQIEARLVVYKEQLRYSCLEDGVRYCVQIQSKNSSGYFGEASLQKYVDIEPRELKNASATLEGNNIRVTCQKPENPYTCLMNVFCDKEKVAESLMGHSKEDVIEQHREKEKVKDEPLVVKPDVVKRTHVKVTNETQKEVIEWIYTPDKEASEYTFEIWAKSTGNIEGKKSVISPITSRPMKIESVNVKHGSSSPSTDIEIAWEKQPRCNSYEIQVLKQENTMLEAVWKVSDKNTVLYKCLSPGGTYSVSVRAICQSTHGEWSDEQTITLAPVEVEFKESSRFIEKAIPLVKSIFVEWKSLDIKPMHYRLQLYCDGEKVGEPILKPPECEMKHTFDIHLIKPGSLCYSTIEAFNGGQYGKQTKSKICRIEWGSPGFITVQHDDNDPTTKAVVKWSSAAGVSFRLTIENHQTGDIKSRDLPGTEEKYNFNGALPGNTYTMKLYWGCDGEYSERFAEDTITMKPNPPVNVKVVANANVRGLGIDNLHSEIANATYEICVRSEMHPTFKHTESISKDETWTLQNLIPGAKYEILVTTVIDDMRSEAALSTCFTYPQKVENLHAIYINGKIKFEWDQPDVKPDKYVVKWMVNNGQMKEDDTEMTSFMIDHRKAGAVYSLRVAASNPSGCGEMTAWKNYIAGPHPPNNISVKPIRGSSGLIINYKDDTSPEKKYEIILESQKSPGKLTQHNTENHCLTVSNLVPGDAYKVSVMTVVRDLKSQPAVSDAYTLTFPGKVQCLQSTFTDGNIVFDWDPPQIKPDQYIVQWKVDNGAVVEETLEEPPFRICRYKPAQLYAVRVMGVNAAGRGTMTAWETFTTAPDPPNDICVKPSTSSIGLIISYTDDPCPEKKYEINLKSQETPESIIQKNTTRQRITMENLTPGDAYLVSVSTIIGKVKSKAAVADGYVATFPGKVQGLQSTFTDGNIVFDWNPPQIQPDQYIIQWRVGSEPVEEETLEEPPFRISSYKPAQLYAVRVMCLNEAGRGPTSAWVTFTTEPNPPSDICVKPCKASKGLIISYTDAASSEKKYEISLESKNTQEKIRQETTAQQCITVANLIPGDAYRVSVITIFRDKRSKAAVSDDYIATFPCKVEKLCSTFVDGNIVFDWELPQIRPDQYAVQSKVGDGAVMEETLEEPPFRICSYKPAQVYAVRVMSLNGAGRGPMTAWDTFTTDPNPPKDICAQPCKKSNGLIISYTDDASSEKKYEITLESQKTREKITEETTTEQCITVANLTPGDAYRVSVATVIGDKRSKAAASNSYTATFPGNIEGLRSAFVKGCIEFNWDSPQIKPDQYIVQCKVGNGPVMEESAEEPSFTIRRFKPAQIYAVRVIGLNEAGRGPMTSWETFATVPLPPIDASAKKCDTSPTKTLVVNFKDERDLQKHYIIQAWKNADEKHPADEVVTDRQSAKLEKLQHGQHYYVTIQTVFCGKISKKKIVEQDNSPKLF